jgi:hypothetical protein
MAPPGPAGSPAVTLTAKVVESSCAGRVSTELVGGVVSISHEVDSEPVPRLPSTPTISAASRVRV